MRSDAEMLELILATAREDARIRAAVLQGSRARPGATRDLFQDWDLVYVVSDLAPFVRNLEWIRRFGELMVLQLPDDMTAPPPPPGTRFTYLMQFTDGNRIDLTILPIDGLGPLGTEPRTVLLDKDGVVERSAPAVAPHALTAPPTAKAFADCCNEFWWVAPYVAKGLWRRELPYARAFLDQVLRRQLTRMLAWRVGVDTGFTRAPGKEGRFLEQLLPAELWQLLLRTYADAGYDHTWEALLTMGELFRRAALPVAERLGFAYPRGEDDRVSAHLLRVRALPPDARELA